jgi:hypothetical protein
MRLLPALAIVAAGAVGPATTPSSAEPLYRYCMIGTPNSFMSCTFNTLQQCQTTASAGAGFCIESSAYLASRHGAPNRR